MAGVYCAQFIWPNTGDKYSSLASYLMVSTIVDSFSGARPRGEECSDEVVRGSHIAVAPSSQESVEESQVRRPGSLEETQDRALKPQDDGFPRATRQVRVIDNEKYLSPPSCFCFTNQ